MNTLTRIFTGIFVFLCFCFTACDLTNHKSECEEYISKAHTEFLAEQYKLSLADYAKACELDSTYGQAFEGKGAAEENLNDYANALKDEFTALRLNPELKNVRSWIGLIKRKMGDYRGSIKYYNKSIELGGSDLAFDYEGRGAAEYDLGENDLAMQDETKAIKMDPDVKNAYYWRGLIKGELKDYDGSLEDHFKSLAIGANKPRDYEGIAAAEFHLGHYKEALLYIDSSISTNDTTLKNVYNWRGHIKQELEDYKGAVDDYTTSIAIGKNTGIDYEGRAVNEYYLKDYSSALRDINTAIAKDSTLKNTTYWKGEIERDMKHGKH